MVEKLVALVIVLVVVIVVVLFLTRVGGLKEVFLRLFR